MSAQAARAVIDSLEFARTGQNLAGVVPVRNLPRLQDCLLDDQGEVRFKVTGGHDARQRPLLKLEISGTLHLRCQRCLGALDYALRLSNVLLLGSGGDEAAVVEADDEEWIEPGAALDVTALVEDEILLGLPYAPMHGEGQCPQAAKAAGGSKETAFAKLAALKRNVSRN